MNRTHWILTGVLAVQVALLVLIAPWSTGAGADTPRPLLPELESFTPAKIEVSQGHDKNNKSVVLDHDGDTWTLEGQQGYPADAKKLDGLLDTLKGLKVRRPVVTSSRYHEALKVTDTDYERRIRIWQEPKGKPKIDLLVGTSPNYRISHVRLEGDDRVYEARGLMTSDLQADAGSWIDKQFVNVPFENVTQVTVSNKHGRFELSREGDDWKVTPAPGSGKTLDKSKVDSFVRQLASLWLSEPAGSPGTSDYGLDDPAATVEITYRAGGSANGGAAAQEAGAPTKEAGAETSAEGKAGTAAAETKAAAAPRLETVTLKVGSEATGAEGSRYASRNGFDHAVILSKFDAEKATEKKLSDLLES